MNCEEIKQKVDIQTVLESFNIFPVKKNRKTAFYFALDREEKIPSLSVDFVNNKAFDFGTGRNYDVISIVQQIKKCSVSEALKFLEKFTFASKNKIYNLQNENEKGYEILAVNDIKHFGLIQYLVSRKVDKQMHLINEVHYKLNGKKFFAIGFFNNSGGMEIRNKYSKICLGKKDVTMIKAYPNVYNEIIIFEGFIDYLTYKSMDTEQNADFLILNSTAMLFKVENELKKYNKISLFLDNDPNGKSVKSKIESQYKNVEDCSLIYRDYKDLNDWYCK